MQKFKFETSPIGQGIHLLSVANNHGVELKCISYGATIISIRSPNREGVSDNVTLCYSEDEIIDKIVNNKSGPYYGCVVGRVANRIKNGKFSIDDKQYNLAVNNGTNHLHGGIEGFDKKIWQWEIINYGDDSAGFRFKYFSKDGEEGYPSNLNVTILNNNSLIILTYLLILLIIHGLGNSNILVDMYI